MTSVWEDRWKAGRTGWDKGKPAPALVQLLTSSSSSSSSFINIPSNGKFLVPGCGGGWDCFVIAETGPNRQVIGFDLSETAVETAKKVLKLMYKKVVKEINTYWFFNFFNC